MMKIAVCDDETKELNYARTLIEAWLKLRPELDGSLRAFQSGHDLIKYIRSQGGFDLYLLDMMMPEQDGIALGRIIRADDRHAAIIYLTSSPDYAVQSYHVRAFHYMLKPFGKTNLYPVLDEFAGHYLREQEATLPVRTHDGIVPVRMAELVSAELCSRVVCCRLAGGSLVTSQVLRESFGQFVSPLLKDSRFLKVGASYVINMSFVNGLAGRELRMQDGSRVTIPRSALSDTRNAYMTYLFERGLEG